MNKKNESTAAISAEDRILLADLAGSRGMTSKAFLGRMLRWMHRLDPSEQAIVLDQIQRGEHAGVAALVLARHGHGELHAIVTQIALVIAAKEVAKSETGSQSAEVARQRA